jgi:hypothetical protein
MRQVRSVAVEAVIAASKGVKPPGPLDRLAAWIMGLSRSIETNSPHWISMPGREPRGPANSERSR